MSYPVFLGSFIGPAHSRSGPRRAIVLALGRALVSTPAPPGQTERQFGTGRLTQIEISARAKLFIQSTKCRSLLKRFGKPRTQDLLLSVHRFD